MRAREATYLLSIVLLSISVIFLTCKKDDPGLIPTYISIDSIQVLSNPAIAHLEGSLSNNITDAWIFVDEEYLGAYELPATFPLLKEGIHTLKVKPGIKINGISATRGTYEFYEPYSIEINFVKDSITIIQPKTSYRDITTFAWNEDFEDGHSSIQPSNRSDTIVVLTSDPKMVFEGDYSGVIYLDEERPFFEGYSAESYQLPVGEVVFLEMNFKVNNNVLIGLLVHNLNETLQSSVLILNKTDIWKKIYINLTNAVISNPSAISYSFYMQVIKDENVSNSEILIDNIKIVY